MRFDWDGFQEDARSDVAHQRRIIPKSICDLAIGRGALRAPDSKLATCFENMR
jgi:hypothetical protein